MGFAESDLLYVDCPHRKLKSEHFLISYPIFHCSTIPSFHALPNGRRPLWGLRSKPGHLSRDSSLFPVNTIDGTIFYGVIYVRFRIGRKLNDFDITGII